MERANTWIRRMGIGVNILTVLVIAAAVVGIAITPVMAQYRGGPGWGHERHWKHPRYRHVRPGPVVVAPAPMYAPPPVVYAPPPPPPPGISIVFPINIR